MKKILLLSSIIIFMSSGSLPQQQSWILQNLQASMSGIHLYKAGGDCIVHTRASSQYIYFFDINNKNWIEYDIGSQQNMIAVEAGKHVAMAYSDTLLIAFSSKLSTCKSIRYFGNIISPNGTVSGTRGYGCGDNGAYVFTEQNIMYVFDALIGEWKSYQYGEVQNASGASNFWCGDKYVAGIFQRFYPDKYRNVAYSLITGTFNQTDMGGVYYASTGIAMTGGFVSTYAGGPEIINTGYSAYTNLFYTIQEDPPLSNLTLGYMDESWMDCVTRNVYGYALTRGDAQSRELKINTFDTQRAIWVTYTTSFTPSQIYGPSNLRVGGNTSITSMYDVNGPVTFYIYSGETGSYNIYPTGVLYNAHPYYYNVGLESAMTLDDWNHGWFHNSKTGFSQSITFQDSIKTNYLMSTEYGSFCRYSNYQSTMMDLWFFNSKTNRLSKTTISKDASDASYSPYSFVMVNISSNNAALFYSPIHDSIMFVNSSLTYRATRGIFSWLYNTGSTLLFDAANLNLVELNSNPVSSMHIYSDSLMLFKTEYVYTVYDASNKLTTTFDLGGLAGYNIMNGNIVLVSNSNNSKYYAFQKTKTDWNELLPEGNHLGVSVGNNTALVVRHNKIYAFAPDGLNEFVPENTIPVKSFSLSQNFPNPFNPSTRIQYQVPSISQVVLKIYDVLGNEIATLVNEEQSEGVYEIEFNASKLSSGVYFYRLQADVFSETKKFMLIK